ncbi:hypothetical protein [Mannheimia massilioguelmaensis]|uniref:hypothetical protein n=1 Tax=Mannheimia massilioguelmaensis TaxID=1604354 RepID=UPI0005C88889|nr:hypothetical protein [Mannheimia massilioguelmaensis]
MKKLWSVILVFCFFITSCSTKPLSTEGEITHAKFTDYSAIVKIDNKTYELRAGKQAMQQFKEFYHDYYPKVAKQALTLNILTNRQTDFTYSFFIENNKLDKDTKLKLENLYQAKPYQDKYIMISFTANAEPYYYGNELETIAVDKYKLGNAIPILITETTPFEETGGGQTLLLLTSPIWLPFMLLFGLKV